MGMTGIYVLLNFFNILLCIYCQVYVNLRVIMDKLNISIAIK